MTSKYFEYQTVTFSMPARFTSWGNEMFANNNLTSETVGGLIYSRPYKTPKIMCVRIYQKIKVPKQSQYLNLMCTSTCIMLHHLNMIFSMLIGWTKAQTSDST